MSSFLIPIVLALALISLSSSTTAATCRSKTFSAKNFASFTNCNDLPTLDAVLHWTYAPSLSSLVVAFTATPPTPDGWVAWALNPRSTGMVGAQSLIAFKPTSSGPIFVSTYDIQSYHSIIKGPISFYNVTDVSAEETDGQITIFATWKIPEGFENVNQVWQVGPVVKGKPGMHEFEKSNLESKMKLSLNMASGPVSGPVDEPTESPDGSIPSGGTVDGGSAPAPAKGGAVKRMSAFWVSFLVLGLGVFVVSMF